VDCPSTVDFFNWLCSKKCKIINLNNEPKEFSYVTTTDTLKRLLLYDYLYHVVRIVTSHGLDDLVSIPCRSKRCFSSPKRPEHFCSPHNLLCNKYLANFPRGKATGTWNCPLTPGYEVKNEWNHNANPTCLNGLTETSSPYFMTYS